MKVKFSALVSGMSGKLNGSVASHKKGTAYFRNRVKPTNRKTDAQQTQRAFFSQIAKAWRALTQAQRDQWNAAVTNFKYKNVFGDVKIISGSNLFQKLNLNLLTIGIAPINVPPLPTEVVSVTGLSLTATKSTGAISIDFDTAIDVTVTGEVWATPALSAGVSFVKSQYRLIGTIDHADSTTIDVKTMYDSVFGAVGATGQKIFVEIKPIASANGIPGIPVSASTIIA